MDYTLACPRIMNPAADRMHERDADNEYLNPMPDQQVDRFLIACIADVIVPRLRGPRVLEMGVGHRVWSPKLLARFPSVTTVDLSARLLDRLRSEVSGTGWTGICSAFEEFSPEELFDSVVCTYVLEHVDDPLSMLVRVRGWLRAGGEVAIVVPNGLSLHRRLAGKMGLLQTPTDLGATDRRLQHRRCFTPVQVENLITAAGFRVTERCGLLTKALPNSLLVHCTPEQLRGLVLLGMDLPLELAAAVYWRAEV